MKRGTLILLLAILSLGVSGQGDRWLSGRVSEGFLMAHRPTIPQLLQGHARTIEFTYMVRSNGSKDWHHLYKGPLQGVALIYSDLGNREQLGRAYSLIPFIDFPLKQGEKGALLVRLGVGLTVVDRTFDRLENTRNLVIGSKGNVGILASFRYQHGFGRLLVGAGLSFSHASNGSYQLPNLGANVPAADLYLGFRLNGEKKKQDWTSIPPRERPVRWDAELGLGFRESNTVSRDKHPALELRVSRSKPFSEKMGYILGADLGYSKASYAELGRDSVKVINSLLPGLKTGLTLDLGTATLFLEVGGYLRTEYQELGSIYNRFGGRKTIRERYTVSLVLKTHFARADYFALGVGYRFE